jgi:hypothetical protein
MISSKIIHADHHCRIDKKGAALILDCQINKFNAGKIPGAKGDIS